MWYIITWCLLIQTPIPCPEMKWKTDEFGRLSLYGAGCCANHIKIEEDCDHVKKEYNSKDAYEFYNECKKQKDISKLKIDSTKAEAIIKY